VCVCVSAHAREGAYSSFERKQTCTHDARAHRELTIGSHVTMHTGLRRCAAKAFVRKIENRQRDGGKRKGRGREKEKRRMRLERRRKPFSPHPFDFVDDGRERIGAIHMLSLSPLFRLWLHHGYGASYSTQKRERRATRGR
jgi:hypothetical protein